MILKKVGLIITLFCLNLVTTAQVKTLYPQGLKVGERAPLFSAKNQDGSIINLKKLLIVLNQNTRLNYFMNGIIT